MSEYQVKIDSKAIEEKILSSIMKSAIGDNINKSINKAINEKYKPYDKKTILQEAIDSTVEGLVIKIVKDELTKQKDAIRDEVSKRITTQLIIKITKVAVDSLVKRIDDMY